MLGILSKLHDSLCLSSSDHFKFHDVHAFASLGLPFFKHVEVATYEDYLLVSVVTGDSFREQNKTVIFKVYQASNQVLYLLYLTKIAILLTELLLPAVYEDLNLKKISN